MKNSIHHVALCLNVEYCVPSVIKPNINIYETRYNFAKGNYKGLNNYLVSVDWLSILSGLNLKEMYVAVLNILELGFIQFIPLIKKRDYFKQPWHNKRLVNLKNAKNKAFKQWKNSNSEFNR